MSQEVSQTQAGFKSLKVIRIQLILLLNIILKLQSLKQTGFDFFIFRLQVFLNFAGGGGNR